MACAILTCEGTHYAKGKCLNCYNRERRKYRDGDRRLPGRKQERLSVLPIDQDDRAELQHRIASRVIEDSSCLIWMGATQGTGYGKITWRGTTYLTHRIVYELVRGPIGPRLEINHICENKRCLRPDHLEAVTHRQNLAAYWEERTCAFDGCPKKTKEYWCETHATRAQKYGDPSIKRPPRPERDLGEELLKRTVIRDGCWIWTAAKTSGHGVMRWGSDNRVQFACRLAYEHWVATVPSGARVRHECGNTSCIKPEHLALD